MSIDFEYHDPAKPRRRGAAIGIGPGGPRWAVLKVTEKIDANTTRTVKATFKLPANPEDHYPPGMPVEALRKALDEATAKMDRAASK